MCFSAPAAPPPPPTPPPLPPPPTEQSPEVTKARKDSRQRAALASGRNSTILTSAQGLTDAPAVTGKTLLGQ
jgi:hypothetical protein